MAHGNLPRNRFELPRKLQTKEPIVLKQPTWDWTCGRSIQQLFQNLQYLPAITCDIHTLCEGCICFFAHSARLLPRPARKWSSSCTLCNKSLIETLHPVDSQTWLHYTWYTNKTGTSQISERRDKERSPLTANNKHFKHVAFRLVPTNLASSLCTTVTKPGKGRLRSSWSLIYRAHAMTFVTWDKHLLQ